MLVIVSLFISLVFAESTKLPKNFADQLLSDTTLLDFSSRQQIRKLRDGKISTRDFFLSRYTPLKARDPKNLDSKLLAKMLDQPGLSAIVAARLIRYSKRKDLLDNAAKSKVLLSLGFDGSEIREALIQSPYVPKDLITTAKNILKDKKSDERLVRLSTETLQKTPNEQAIRALFNATHLRSEVRRRDDSKILIERAIDTLIPKLASKKKDLTPMTQAQITARLIKRVEDDWGDLDELYQWDSKAARDWFQTKNTGEAFIRKLIEEEVRTSLLWYLKTFPTIREPVRKLILNNPKLLIDFGSLQSEPALVLFSPKELLQIAKSVAKDPAKALDAIDFVLETKASDGNEFILKTYPLLPKDDKKRLLRRFPTFELPPKIVAELVEQAYQGRESNCELPDVLETSRDSEKQKDRVRQAAQKIKAKLLAKAAHCIRTEEFPTNICRWWQLSNLFGAPSKTLKTDLMSRFDGMKREFHRNKIAECVAESATWPRDKSYVQHFLKKIYPNRSAIIDKSYTMEQLRRDLPQSGRHALDEIIEESLRPPRKTKEEKLSACQMICQLRKSSKKWLDPNYFKNPEFGESISEQNFAIENLVHYFDRSTRSLCKNSEKDFAFLNAPFSKLPPALGMNKIRAIQTEVARKEKNLKETDSYEQYGIKIADKLLREKAIAKDEHTKMIDRIKKDSKDRRYEISRRLESIPGLVSNSLVYGLSFGSLLQAKLTREENQKNRKTLAKIIDTHHKTLKNFKKYPHRRSSAYTNYAVALGVIAAKKVPENVLAYMKETVDKLKNPCTVPYSSDNAKPGAEGDAVFRSVLFYDILRKQIPEKEKVYRDKLFTCLKRYKDHLPRGQQHAKRNLDSHVNGGGIAPYYFYSTVPFAAKYALELSKDPNLSKDEQNAMTGVALKIFDTLEDNFERKEKMFVTTASEFYTSRPTYTNPLYGLTLVPFCKQEKGI